MSEFETGKQRSESRASTGMQRTASPYHLQCRACGFEPDDSIIAPLLCPKCCGGSWERFAYPGSLLVYADQHGSSRRARGGRRSDAVRARDNKPALRQLPLAVAEAPAPMRV